MTSFPITIRVNTRVSQAEVERRYQRVLFADTENEVADGDLDQDYEIILKRLTKLEKVRWTMAGRVLFDF